MTQKQAHSALFLFDLLGIVMIWMAYNEFQRIPIEISNQLATIRFGNRVGFLVVGIGIPIFHILILMDRLKPNIAKKHRITFNSGIILLIISLIVSGFATSSWMKSQVENAGYVYCRQVSGAGATSKTLVYAKDIKTCEYLAEKRKKDR